MTDSDGGGDVITDTGLQIGCFDEIPRVFIFECNGAAAGGGGHEMFFSTMFGDDSDCSRSSFSSPYTRNEIN